MSDRNDSVIHNTEDKGWWCHHGEKFEHTFVELCRAHLGIDAKINPDKQTNIYAPDLIVEGVISDLKVQNTPFFVARRYGLDPRHTVTFNRKDYERYKKLYPGINIYFWVEWTQTESKFGKVEYMAGIYRLSFERLAKLIEDGAPEHRYIHRKNDTGGNAKSSFLLDLGKFEQLLERSSPTSSAI